MPSQRGERRTDTKLWRSLQFWRARVMVRVRSKWSLRSSRWRRVERSGVVGGPDPTRRQPAHSACRRPPRPFRPGATGSIRPTARSAVAMTRDRAGGLHLLWKDEGNTRGQPSGLWSQPLTADGLALAGTAHRLLSARRPWQDDIVEEPATIPAADGG